MLPLASWASHARDVARRGRNGHELSGPRREGVASSGRNKTVSHGSCETVTSGGGIRFAAPGYARRRTHLAWPSAPRGFSLPQHNDKAQPGCAVSDLVTSGGGIRTHDLRVMSPLQSLPKAFPSSGKADRDLTHRPRCRGLSWSPPSLLLRGAFREPSGSCPSAATYPPAPEHRGCWRRRTVSHHRPCRRSAPRAC
jgi:hypothetical protein